MYFRWKKRKLSSKDERRICRRGFSSHTWYAVLVQSERRDGKPRQKIICTLGHIPGETFGSHVYIRDRGNPYIRLLFWDSVDRKLSALEAEGTLGATDRAKIEQNLLMCVKRPTEAELRVEDERRTRASEAAHARLLAMIAAHREGL